MPPWFVNALAHDREGLMRGDAFRSLVFISLAFLVLYFEMWKKLAPIAFYSFLIFIVLLDSAIVDARYFTKDDYRRKRENTFFTSTEADQEILKDKSYYRVFNLDPQNPASIFLEARTSYFHNSIGGYHAVKLRRYQDLYDSCVFKETTQILQDASGRKVGLLKIWCHQHAQCQVYCIWARKRQHNPQLGRIGKCVVRFECCYGELSNRRA